MRAQIITSREDVLALLRHVHGVYAPTPVLRITSVIVAGASLLMVLWGLRDLKSASAVTVNSITAVLSIIAFAPLAKIALDLALTSYHFDEHAISVLHPLPSMRRKMDVDSIRAGFFRIRAGRGYYLEILAESGRELSIPLVGRLLSDFAILYPEVASAA